MQIMTSAKSEIHIILWLDVAVALLAAVALVSFEPQPTVAAVCAFLAALVTPIVLLRWKIQTGPILRLPLGYRVLTIGSLVALAVAWFLAVVLSAGTIQSWIAPPSSWNIVY